VCSTAQQHNYNARHSSILGELVACSCVVAKSSICNDTIIELCLLNYFFFKCLKGERRGDGADDAVARDEGKVMGGTANNMELPETAGRDPVEPEERKGGVTGPVRVTEGRVGEDNAGKNGDVPIELHDAGEDLAVVKTAGDEEADRLWGDSIGVDPALGAGDTKGDSAGDALGEREPKRQGDREP